MHYVLGVDKYADDTYLIMPTDNLQSCQEEIANVESWANHNNLKLNHAKSAEKRICAAEMAVRYAALSACRKEQV